MNIAHTHGTYKLCMPMETYVHICLTHPTLRICKINTITMCNYVY